MSTTSAGALALVILTALPSTAVGVAKPPRAPDPVSRLEVRLRSAYAALPRDGGGLPDSSGVRYLARRYLEAEHGWVVKGLDTAPWLRDGRNASQAAALRASELLAAGTGVTASGPLLGALSPEPGRGFTLRQAAEVVLALEEIMASHDAALMHQAVALSKVVKLSAAMNDGPQAGSSVQFSESDTALYFYAVLLYTKNAEALMGQGGGERAFEELTTLLTYFSQDMVGKQLEVIVAEAVQKATMYPSLSYDGFGAMRHLRSLLYERFARRWCPRLRGVLSSMDHDGSGQLEFHRAYATRSNLWQFIETPEYLGALGALAEKSATGGGPGVLIPNYVSGISNCASPGAHPAMLCCPDECEADILPRLEAAAAGPRIAPKQVWAALSRLIKGGRMATADKRKELHSQLRALGRRSGDGLVEVHGRRLGRWLHRAFPHKCRGPSARGSASVVDPTLSGAAWTDAGKFLPTEEEDVAIIRAYLQFRLGADGTGTEPHSFAARSAMGLDQELQLVHKLHHQHKAGGPPVQQALEDALNVRVLDRSGPGEHLLAAVLAAMLLGPLAAVVALMGWFPAEVCSFLAVAAAAIRRLRSARLAASHPREGSLCGADVGLEGPREACEAGPAVTEREESTDAEDIESVSPASEYSEVATELSAEDSDSERKTARGSTEAGRGRADADDVHPNQEGTAPDVATKAQQEADPQEILAAAKMLPLAESAGARRLERPAAFPPMGFRPPPGLEPPPGLRPTFEAVGLEPGWQSLPSLDLTVFGRPGSEEQAPAPPHECSVPRPHRLVRQAPPDGTGLVGAACRQPT